MEDFLSFSALLKKFLSDMETSDSSECSMWLLRKSSLVHAIEEEVANASVPEGIIDSLILIEAVDRNMKLPPSNSMKAAFCAVAVHCTLATLTRPWPCFYDAFQRIWKFRILSLEDSGESHLVIPELSKWRKDLEAALWDSDASQRLLHINTHDDALQCLRVYVQETQAMMNPALIRLAAAQGSGRPRRFTDKGKGSLRENPERCKCVSPRRYKRPVRIANSERPSCSKFATTEINKVQEALKTSAADLLASVTDHVTKVLEVAEMFAANREGKKLHTEANLEDGNKDKDKDVPATSVNPTQAKRVEGHGRKGKKVLSSSVNPPKDKSHPPPSSNSTTNPAQAKEANHRSQTSIHQNGVPRNATAYEDSIDDSSQGMSIGSVSPLKKRRKRNMWSKLEEEVLQIAVRLYGRHWEQILRIFPFVFVNRIAGDLKDKWRNMNGE